MELLRGSGQGGEAGAGVGVGTQCWRRIAVEESSQCGLGAVGKGRCGLKGDSVELNGLCKECPDVVSEDHSGHYTKRMEEEQEEKRGSQ